MFGVFLDDERVPADVTWVKYPGNIEWTVCRNSTEFKAAVKQMVDNNRHFCVSFDHDIQEWNEAGEVTGYTIIKEMLNDMLDNEIKIPTCYFHTQNPIGKDNMLSYYINALEWERLK